MENFDLYFDLDSFMVNNADLLEEDKRLGELCSVARRRMNATQYRDARASAEKAAARVEAIRAGTVGLKAGQETERALLQCFDAYDKAQQVLEPVQQTLQHRVTELRNVKSRERWIVENPEAHAAEQAALKQAHEDRMHAQAMKVAEALGAPPLPEPEPAPAPEPEPAPAPEPTPEPAPEPAPEFHLANPEMFDDLIVDTEPVLARPPEPEPEGRTFGDDEDADLLSE